MGYSCEQGWERSWLCVGPTLREHTAHPSKSSHLGMRKLPTCAVSFLLCSSLCMCVYIHRLFLPYTQTIQAPQPKKGVLGWNGSVHCAEGMLQGCRQGTKIIHYGPLNHVSSTHHSSVHGRLPKDLAPCMAVPWGWRRDSSPILGQTKLTPDTRANT